MRISGSIDRDKVKSKYLAKGKYLNFTLVENKDGGVKYGNHGFIRQDIPKEARDAGEESPILGNWKDWDRKEGQASTPPPKPAPVNMSEEEDSVPF